MENISQPCLNAGVVCLEAHIPVPGVAAVARPEARIKRAWRPSLEPLEVLHLAAVSVALLPLSGPMCGRRAPACNCGSSATVDVLAAPPGPPPTRSGRRPDASLSKGRVMERSAPRTDLLEVRGRSGAYGPIYMRRRPAPIPDSARNVSYVVRVPPPWRTACGRVHRRSSRSR
jgi:hypothetical protein